LVVKSFQSKGKATMPQEFKTGQLFSPKGLRIVGTAEVIQAVAIVDSFEKRDNGTLYLNYAGETDVNWNSQKTKTNQRGSKMVVDEGGFKWSEKECRFVADADKSPVTERAI
jgi:hypothetical protein